MEIFHNQIQNVEHKSIALKEMLKCLDPNNQDEIDFINHMAETLHGDISKLKELYEFQFDSKKDSN